MYRTQQLEMSSPIRGGMIYVDVYDPRFQALLCQQVHSVLHLLSLYMMLYMIVDCVQILFMFFFENRSTVVLLLFFDMVTP